jgi:hypothetical protein
VKKGKVHGPSNDFGGFDRSSEQQLWMFSYSQYEPSGAHCRRNVFVIAPRFFDARAVAQTYFNAGYDELDHNLMPEDTHIEAGRVVLQKGQRFIDIMEAPPTGLQLHKHSNRKVQT